MANTSLFRTMVGPLLPETDACNSEGAPAYAYAAKHALAQYAATGCFNRTYYASKGDQLKRVIELAYAVDPAFVAKTAVFARERGRMKDVPALLCAALSFTDALEDRGLLERVFPRVIDNGKMLRNFVQILRSGVIGRKSLGSRPKRLVRQWLAERSDEAVFRASVGQSPSLADVVRLVHPKPETASRRALYAWLLDRSYEAAELPECVRAFEAFKATKAGSKRVLPDVPFLMLTALELSASEWAGLARNMGWQALRMNLNTLARHGVFERKLLGLRPNEMTARVAARLVDRLEIAKSGVFPYQLFAAARSVGAEVPRAIANALEEAMEVAIENVPEVGGQVYICPDVSGSMQSPVTGHRKGATTAVRCVDVAALIAAAILRKNRKAEVLPFEEEVVDVRLNPRDAVVTNARKLAAIGGGGTSCSAPLRLLNERQATGDLVVFISDNESWVDARAGRGTALLEEWAVFRQRSPQARMVCIDIQPNETTQAKECPEILNVGGFSDAVFELCADFAAGRLVPGHWVQVIEAIEI